MGVSGGFRHDIPAEAGGDHHRQIRPDFKHLLGQLHTRQAGHGEIGEEQVEGCGPCEKFFQRLLWIGMRGHKVTGSRQHLVEHIANGRLVIHQKDLLAGAWRRGL